VRLELDVKVVAPHPEPVHQLVEAELLQVNPSDLIRAICACPGVFLNISVLKKIQTPSGEYSQPSLGLWLWVSCRSAPPTAAITKTLADQPSPTGSSPM
jgi:hypothetical protein